MAQDSTKMRLGACSVSADGTNIGYTIGETVITFDHMQVDGFPSQTSAPSEAFSGDQIVTAKGQFAQATDNTTLLNYIMPDTTVAGDKISGGRTPGYRSSQNTFLLLLHPEDQGAVTTYDFKMYKALGTGKTTVAYTREGITVYDFEFKGYYDDTRTDNDRVWSFGDSADAAAPTRTSTTPADAAAAIAVTDNTVIVFSETMSTRTLVVDGISPSVVLYDQANQAYVACDASISTTTNTNDTLTMNPDSNMAAAALHDVIVTEYATDVAGNRHAGSQTDFTTA